MDEIRDFLRSRSVANLTVVIINVAVFLILSCFGDTENADFMAAHGASYTPYIVQDGKYYLHCEQGNYPIDKNTVELMKKNQFKIRKGGN